MNMHGVPWYHYYLRQALWGDGWVIIYPKAAPLTRPSECNRVLVWGPYEWTASESILFNDCIYHGKWK